MKVLLACTDLFFASRIVETARLAGADLVQAREDLADVAARERPELVLVDLHADALAPTEAIRAIRGAAPKARIVAFVRHEEVERIRAAREAGADEVHARNAFTRRLPALLGKGAGG